MTDDKERQPATRAKRVFLEPDRAAADVRIAMLDDEQARALKLIEDSGWKTDEGLHIIFSHGLVALEHERTGGAELEGKRLLDMKTHEEREAFLLARLSALESKYSVMKFTSFNALRDNETLRMNVTGLTTEYRALAEQNKYLRGREDELRAQVTELERTVAELRGPLQVPAGRPRSRWERVKELVRVLLERSE